MTFITNLTLNIIIQVMNQYEISKLKKQLLRKNEVIKQLKQDLNFVQNQLVTVQAQRDKYHGQLQIARHTIQNVDQMIDQKVRDMKNKLEVENAGSLTELQSLRTKLIEEQDLNQKINQQIRNKDAVISQLSLRLKEMANKHKDNSMQLNVKQISEQAAITYNQFYKLTEKYNKLSEDMENVLAENKILRKLHGVPDNFGFDLQQIKIAEKQELEDYKAQCRKLQAEIQELEGERTQLRYRLRQYNTLYSNKGQRYKDLTQRQLELLDIYAMNLKEGKDQFPQIDKSQKQMEKQIIRLRAQIEVLQSKAPMPLIGGSRQQQSSSNQISKDTMKKLQDQIKGILEPFVQDIKKLSQTNLNSIIQNFQNINTENNVNVNNNLAVGYSIPTGERHPMPLPFSNNDWSTIKEGYSYRYSCKIPIDIKDYENDIGFDIVKAKYEIAALQLQNIESLKMLKQKQDQQKIIISELNQLKEKYKKCLLVQDQLFLKYFKARDQFKQNTKQIQIQRRRFSNERDEFRVQLQTLKQAYHSLVAKTEVERKMKEFGQRVAKSQAGLMKNQRKYQILLEEYKSLKESYTKLELKTAQNETNLKLKCINARKNEKQLTLLMNQVLQQSKDSVSSDTHNLLLAKMQLLNDKSAHFAFKEAELRTKISRLESIQRQMNIKDDVIEYLRQDKLDLLLELQIIRNRLKSIDANYRRTMAIFQRLIGFVNQNSISILQCFKKFDRDKSGILNKVEFKSALDAFGFNLKNDQYDLLFGQFDVDGSASVSYTQFMRKLKRSGAVSRSQDEQAIYLFFKAIKSSNISIKRAFSIVDKDGSGNVSKSEMQTAFRQIGIECDSKTVDAIFRIVDSDFDNSVSCPQLQKLYYQIVRETQIDQNQLKPSLDWKYNFILQVEQATVKNKMSLQETFKTLDDDGNSYLTIQQLSVFLSKLGVMLENRNLRELFKFLDTKFDGRVEFSQFLKLLDDAKKQKKRVDRLLAVQKRSQELRKQNEQVQQKSMVDSKGSEQAILKIRMEALQTKQSNIVKRNEKLCKSIALKEQEIKELQRSIEENEKQVNNIQDKYTKERQNNIYLADKMKKFVGEAEAAKIKSEIEKIRIKNIQISTELETYKQTCSVLTDKNKLQLMSVKKTEAELYKLYDVVKNLQVENINKSELGRLSVQLEHSKRNEEIINKKFEDACQEVKNLAKQNTNLSIESLDKEKQIVNAHLLMREKVNLLQRNIDSLTAKILPTITSSKIDEFMSKLRLISTEKSQLEEQNKALREKNFNLQLKYDHIQIEKSNLIELEKKLRRNYTDESSTALIDLTKQLSEYKMNQLKAKRQYGLLKEKEEYYMRINNANADSIKDLQTELSKWEIKFNEREEFWRKRLADQMKVREQLEKEVQKTKENQAKAKSYFKDRQVQEAKLDQKYMEMGQQREKKLSQFVKPSIVYKQTAKNNQKIQQLKEHINELTQQLNQRQKQIYRLKSTLQEIVPQDKMRFSTVGNQFGPQTNSFVLQTQLTTSQLKNNARRFLNNQKEQQTFFKQEAERMAQAAQQSIDTLQRIIDDKNDQLKRKQKIIQDLKRDMIKSKQQDCYEIQKLNEQIRDLRSKRQIGSLDQLMNKSTHKQFYPSSHHATSNNGNQQKIKSLIQMIEDKDAEIRNWEKKYNELYISKTKAKPAQSNNKVYEMKLKQVMEERENQRKKYVQAQSKTKEKIKNLEKLIKQKDNKLGQLQKSIIDIKEKVLNQKQEIHDERVEGNEQIISQMMKGNSGNDGRLEAVLQKNIQQLQLLKKKNKQYENQIKRMKDEARLNRTMSKR